MRRTESEAEETKNELMTVATGHFSKYGYAKTSLETIVSEVSMTRGALYHHFKNKKGLFTSVLEGLQAEVSDEVVTASDKYENNWDKLYYGCRAFIETSVSDTHRQIVLIDAPSVLGWNEWRQLDSEHSMKNLKYLLFEMKENEEIEDLSVDMLTHSLSGAMNESALLIASNPEDTSIDAAMDVLKYYFEGLMK